MPKKLMVALIALSVAAILSLPNLGMAGALEDIIKRGAGAISGYKRQPYRIRR